MGTEKTDKCVIISSGDLYHDDVGEIVSNALILCADGGARNANKMGISADVLIGDGDSLGNENDVKYNTFIRLPTCKDVTDTMACVQYAEEKGCKDFYLLCCTGGRMDHLLANISILEYLANQNKYAVIIDDCNEIRCISTGIHEVQKSDKYKYLSLIALDSEVTSVSLDGLKYPLFDYTLKRNFAIGVSNEFVEETATINIKSGTCLLIRSRDRR